MNSIDKLVETVQDLEQKSIMMDEHDNQEKRDSLKDLLIMTLATVKMSKSDPKNFSRIKLYEKLESKLANSVSRIETK